MTKVLRKSFLTPFGRVKIYIFSTFFVFDFPSRVTYFRAEMVYKLLKKKLFVRSRKNGCTREIEGHARVLAGASAFLFPLRTKKYLIPTTFLFTLSIWHFVLLV